jgi:hypothetical protein
MVAKNKRLQIKRAAEIVISICQFILSQRLLPKKNLFCKEAMYLLNYPSVIIYKKIV